ncbi:MAG: bifunctional DNA-formamidopyrimidine glycosylase/DNA-(apurinic or apyrimidinic site) lyase [Pseudomonadota bacterium]
MPELPEVETIARDLRAQNLPGSRVEEAIILHPKIIRGGATPFARGLRGTTVASVGRHGKLLLIDLNCEPDGGLVLTVHLGMTGQLTLVPEGTPLASHTHAVFGLNDGRQLRFRDIRRFGRLALLGGREAQEVLKRDLGPDALEIGEEDLASLLRSRRVGIKTLLLNQRLLAGVGNIYANEILFAARINPWRAAGGLSGEEVHRLHHALKTVLSAAIEGRGSTISDYADVSGRAGNFQTRHQVYRKERCPSCGGPILRVAGGGRPTFYCPACQPAIF